MYFICYLFHLLILESFPGYGQVYLLTYFYRLWQSIIREIELWFSVGSTANKLRVLAHLVSYILGLHNSIRISFEIICANFEVIYDWFSRFIHKAKTKMLVYRFWMKDKGRRCWIYCDEHWWIYVLGMVHLRKCLCIVRKNDWVLSKYVFSQISFARARVRESQYLLL